MNCETIKIYSHEIIKKLYNLLSVLNITKYYSNYTMYAVIDKHVTSLYNA